MKRFTHKNEGFTCQHCSQIVPDATSTCRNHCTECLHSLHVDVNPGDRASGCRGLMMPVAVEIKGGLPSKLVHECLQCGYKGRNKVAADDNRENIAKIMEKMA